MSSCASRTASSMQMYISPPSFRHGNVADRHAPKPATAARARAHVTRQVRITNTNSRRYSLCAVARLPLSAEAEQGLSVCVVDRGPGRPPQTTMRARLFFRP